MLERILVPFDGSESAAIALAYAARIPSRRVTVLRVDRPTAGDAAVDDLAAAASVVSANSPPERAVETVVARGDPAAEILSAADGTDLVVMAARGAGSDRRSVFGSVVDRVVHHSPVPVLVVRGQEPAAGDPDVRRITVTLDGSSCSESALPLGFALASDLGVPVRLLRVVEADPIRDAVRGGPLAAAAETAATERAVADAGRYLDGWAHAPTAAGLDVSAEVRTGYPVTEIEEALEPGDLLVIASRGRNALGRWLLGSVSDRLARESPTPILIVPTRER